MNAVLSKVIVAQYYKINAGFFLVAFILLFGLLDGKSTMQLHYGIMQGITGSYVYMFWAAAVWVLYGVKCVTFILKEINNPSNSFLFTSQAMGDAAQLSSWLVCYSMLLLPMLVYGGLAVVVGILHSHYMLAALFAFFQFGLCACGALLFFRRINSTWLTPAFTVPQLLPRLKKYFPFYLLHFSLHTRKATFISVKLLSLLLLHAMLAANAYEINKESICVLMMFVISAHALLPVYYVRFMEGTLAFIRNMPLRPINIYLVYALTYSVVFLPELFFLLVNGYYILPLQLIISIYVVAIGQLLFYTSIQYLHKMNTEKYTMVVFAFFFGSLLFLASFNLWLMAIIITFISILIFIKQINYHEISTN